MTLRVIFQIVPFGDESAVREIDRINISNSGPSYGMSDKDGLHCDYRIHDTSLSVKAHRRDDGARELVRRALELLCDDAQWRKFDGTIVERT